MNVLSRLKVKIPQIFMQNIMVSAEDSTYKLISQDIFATIADWYHLAILDLSLMKDFKSSPSWISARLGISVLEAKIAVDRLVRLGFFKVENVN